MRCVHYRILKNLRKKVPETFIRISLIILFIIICTTSGFSQSKKTLRLFVLENGKQPIAGANVLLFIPGEDEFSEYCVTNTDGFCEIRGLENPVYNFKVSFVGFKTFEEQLTLNDNAIEVVRIELEASREELDQVYVIAEKEITTGQVGITRISSEEISRVPSMNIDGDLMAYIQTIPGVITVGDQGGDLYIRGGTPAQNYVLIDNIPIVKPFHISNLFSAFPDQAISNVDVMAGGFDNEFMGGNSAVIDATLKTGDFLDYSSSSSFSPYISGVFFEGPIRESSSSLMINGRYSTISQFSGYLGTQQQDMQFYDLIARYSLKGDGFNCSISGIFTGDKGRISTRRDNYLNWSNTGIGLRCFGFAESFNHPYEVSLGRSVFNNSEGDKFNTDRKGRVAQTYLRLDLEEFLIDQKIEYGFNLILQEYSATVDEKYTSLGKLDVKVPLFQIYAKTEFSVTNSLKILPSLGTQLSTLTKTTFEPRLRLLWRPTGTNKSEVSFATGIYNQIMDGITDQRDAGTTFTVFRPNKIGEPSPKSFHLIGGLKNKISEKWTTNIEAYYKNNENIPVSKWNPQAKLELETTRANSTGFGADFRISYESEIFYGYLGYGWSQVEYSAGIDDLGAWIQGEILKYSPPHDQRHKFNTLGNLKLGDYTLSANWDFGSGLPYTQVLGFDLLLDIRNRDIIEGPGTARTLYSEPYGKRLPYYHRLDISMKRGFDFSDSFKFEAEIGAINLYDRSNVFYVDLNTVERINQTSFLPYFSVKASIK